MLDVRQFQMAFRRLRQFSAREDGPKDVLQLEETIQETGDNAGRLKLVFGRPRRNTVKLLMLFDSGGSMWEFTKLCASLFQAVSRESKFKDLKTYYFHNCFYDDLYTAPGCHHADSVSTEWVLQQLGQEAFFEPLQMNRSGWDPLDRFPREQIMPTEECEFRGRTIQGEIHDESAWVLRKLFPVGSAGMFSTVPDLLRFVQMVLNDGVFEGKTVAPKGLLDLVSHNAFAPEVGAETALGWELNAERFMGSRHSPRTFGKTGFTGASIVADPEKGAAAVLLSNFTWPHREPSADRINQFRAALSDLFFGQV